MSLTTTCEFCHDTGYVLVTDPDKGGAVHSRRCLCQRVGDAQRKLARLEPPDGPSNLTPEMALMTFATWDRAQHRAAFAAAKRFAQQPEGWLVFVGNTGAGKTHLMAAIAQALRDGVASGAPAPLYVTAAGALEYFKQGFLYNDEARRVALLETAEVLLVDDIGAENTTAWAESALGRVFDERYRRRLPTVLASNVHPKKWPIWVGSRASDRSLAKVCLLMGDDYRLLSLEERHGARASAEAEAGEQHE